ncbi:MAG: DUF3343 domain-containing protein [Thermodesulfobacteriota bacterium]
MSVRAKETVIFILPSIHHVLRAEKVLQKAGQDFDLVPVPKEVNPDCGLAVEADPDQAGRVARLLAGAGLKIEAAFHRKKGAFLPWNPGPESTS